MIEKKCKKTLQRETKKKKQSKRRKISKYGSSRATQQLYLAPGAKHLITHIWRIINDNSRCRWSLPTPKLLDGVWYRGTSGTALVTALVKFFMYFLLERLSINQHDTEARKFPIQMHAKCIHIHYENFIVIVYINAFCVFSNADSILEIQNNFRNFQIILPIY